MMARVKWCLQFIWQLIKVFGWLWSMIISPVILFFEIMIPGALALIGVGIGLYQQPYTALLLLAACPAVGYGLWMLGLSGWIAKWTVYHLRHEDEIAAKIAAEKKQPVPPHPVRQLRQMLRR